MERSLQTTAPAAGVRARAGILVTAALLATSGPSAALPSGPAPLRVDCRAVGGRLRVAIDLGPVLGADLEERLGNGLSGRVRLTVAALDPAGATAATATRDVDVLFDVWAETFTVTVSEPGGPAASRQAADWASVRRRLATPEPFDLGPLAALPERFTVEARLELDPLTAGQLERTRQLLTHPAGGPAAGSRSLLGTMAALLLRAPPPQADLFRSAPFRRAELAAP